MHGKISGRFLRNIKMATKISKGVCEITVAVKNFSRYVSFIAFLPVDFRLSINFVTAL